MALGTTNISTILVLATLLDTSPESVGVVGLDVGMLCTHPNVNKWSKWKPIRLNKVSGITGSDLESVGSGIFRNDEVQFPWIFDYAQPRGAEYDEPFRLGDFRNYNHASGFPVGVNIISVVSGEFGTQTVAPFTVIKGYSYLINFKMPIAGEIDPSTIDPRANRTKNTNVDGGYGGLSFVSGDYTDPSKKYYRSGSEVFSCPSPAVNTQMLTILNEGRVRIQYYKYLGDADGRYESVHGLWAENDDLYSYFIEKLLNVSFEFRNPPLFYNNIEENVDVRTTITSGEDFDVPIMRMVYKYTINGGAEQTHTTADFSVNSNTSFNSSVPLGFGVRNQTNYYTIRAWLQAYNNASGIYIDVSYRTINADIFVPNPN